MAKYLCQIRPKDLSKSKCDNHNQLNQANCMLTLVVEGINIHDVVFVIWYIPKGVNVSRKVLFFQGMGALAYFFPFRYGSVNFPRKPCMLGALSPRLEDNVISISFQQRHSISL
jgi:hypothetical protein